MKKSMKQIFLFFSIVSCLVANAQNHFTDVSDEAGIDHFFVTHQGTFGGGVAVLDFNNDGHEDLFVAGGAGKNALYKNLGNGTFSNIIDAAGFLEKTSAVVGAQFAAPPKCF